ncbi:MAG TPA: hypothetical protein VG496_06840 [Myxococcales bacterium]|nr:hypothetical protein [Myxococcales bacterium]
MTLLALLLALAQQPAQPTNSAQDQTVGVTQPRPSGVSPDKSATSNTTDKAEPLPTEHNTDLQGSKAAKHSKRAKKSKKPQARAKKPLPEASPAPSAEKHDNAVEREETQGKGQQKLPPKPLGEKSNQ